MRRFILLPASMVLALTLVACGGANARVDLTAPSAADAAMNQVRLWNAAGIDPIQLETRELMVAAAGCASLVELSKVVVVDGYDISPETVIRWCEPILTALAPAAVPGPVEVAPSLAAPVIMEPPIEKPPIS